MKRFIFTLLVSIVAAFYVAAADDPIWVKDLWYNDGNSATISWSSAKNFTADQFADVLDGYYIQIDVTSSKGVIELKSNGHRLPGTAYSNKPNSGGAYTYKAYITKDMLADLQAYGLEVLGDEFTITGIKIYNDGFVMPNGAIWGGFFWVDKWNTLELFEEAFNNYDGQRYLDIYLSPENGDNTGYTLNVRTNWDKNGNGIWAQSGNGQVARTGYMATIDLQALGINKSNIAEKLNSDRLMIQGNPVDEKHAFNITAIALRYEPTWIKDLWWDKNSEATITWKSTKSFDKSLFSNVKIGQYIQIDVTSSTGAIELHSNGSILPGTVECITPNSGGAYTYKAYITTDMLAALQAHGLEVCGEFKTNGIKIFDDGFVMPEDAIWGGYTWVDVTYSANFHLFKEAFKGHGDARFIDINHEAGQTNYDFKLCTGWEASDMTIASNDKITHDATSASIDLGSVDFHRFMTTDAYKYVLLNRRSGKNRFNITSIVVRPEPTLVKNLWYNDGYTATIEWKSSKKFTPGSFADVQVGYYIQVDVVSSTGLIELKSNGNKLPGTVYCNKPNGGGAYTYRAYITADMLAALRSGGLEVIGDEFTITGVKIYNDGFVMPEGAIWGGYFWVDGWKQLELFKEAFNNYAGQRYLDVYLSAENGDNTEYTLNARTNWKADGIWAESGTPGQVARTASVATIDLQALGINASNIAQKLNSDRLIIQGYPGDGKSAFNFTAVVLRNDPNAGPSSVKDFDITGDITWGRPEIIPAEQFLDAQVGYYIQVDVASYAGTIELHSNGSILPGTVKCESFGTTNYHDTADEQQAEIYYKPYVGYVGDPMPFFDPVANNFKVMYLQDYRPNPENTYHPIWGVETSDAASYTSLGELIPYGAANELDAAIGTGSTIYHNGTYYTFYTGHSNNGGPNNEVVLLATSTDFRNWTKNRAVQISAGSDYRSVDFRDPCVFKGEDNRFHMLVSTRRASDNKGVLAEYTSDDLLNWTSAGVFMTMMWDRFYECPDLFKMGEWWYLVYSEQHNAIRRVQYFKGKTLAELKACTQNEKTPSWPDSKEGYLNGLGFFAGKTASNGTDRFIWGWCPTKAGNATNGDIEWAGSLVAHKLCQNADGTLYTTEVPAIASHLGTASSLSNLTLNAGESHLFPRLKTRNRIAFTVTTASASDKFGISLGRGSDSGNYYTLVVNPENGGAQHKINLENEGEGGAGFIANNDSYMFPTPAGNVYNVVLVTDNSVVSLYINNVLTYTNRIHNVAENCWSINCYSGTASVSNISVAATPSTYTYKAYITTDMLAAIKAYGLEICGELTTNGVKICNDGFVMPERAIWGGYTWVDDVWNDEFCLFKEAFQGHSDARFIDIYHEAGHPGYQFRALTGWNESDMTIALNEQVRHTANCATIDLKGVDFTTFMNNYNYRYMMLQRHSGGSSFNFTTMVLRREGESTQAVVTSKVVDGGNVNVLNVTMNAYDYCNVEGADSFVITTPDGSTTIGTADDSGNFTMPNAYPGSVILYPVKDGVRQEGVTITPFAFNADAFNITQADFVLVQSAQDPSKAHLQLKIAVTCPYYYLLPNVSYTVGGTSNSDAVSNWAGGDATYDFYITVPNAVNINPDSMSSTDRYNFNFNLTPQYPFEVTTGNTTIVSGPQIEVPITVNPNTGVSGVEGIETDSSDAPVEYYNLQGQRVNGELTPGCYIRRQGSSVTKVMIRF